MFDFTSSFQKIALLRSQLDKAQKTAKKKEDALKAEVAKLMAPLRPICMQAVEEYNKAGGCFVSDSVSLSVNREESTLSLFVRLRYSNGSEPDEEFGWDDEEEKRYNEQFGAVLNRHLAGNSIPLTFGTLSFPSHYYMK